MDMMKRFAWRVKVAVSNIWFDLSGFIGIRKPIKGCSCTSCTSARLADLRKAGL